MGTTLTIVLVLFLLYMGFRSITKPFRDALTDFRSQMQKMKDMNTQTPRESKTRSEHIGEYIDYEELD